MNVSVSRMGSHLTILICAASAISGIQSAFAETAGKAVSIVGMVLVRNEDVPGSLAKPLRAGDSFEKGTVINTNSVGAVKLLFTDKSIIDLGPGTLFKVNEYQLKQASDRQIAMSLPYGQIRASVNTPVSAKGKFTIRTKSATMGVRGTEFVIATDLGSFFAPAPAPAKSAGGKAEAPKAVAQAASQTQITVIHGKVEVRDTNAPKQAPVNVTDNVRYTTSSAPVAAVAGRGPASAEKPKLEQLTKEEVQEIKKEARHAERPMIIAMNEASTGNLGSGVINFDAHDLPPVTPPAPPSWGPDFSNHNYFVPPGFVKLRVIFKK